MESMPERKRVEESLERLRRQSDMVLKATSGGTIGLDAQGDVTFVNPAFTKLLGWESTEVVGKPFHATLHKARPDGSPHPEEECPLHNALKEGKACRVTTEAFWRSDGRPQPVDYLASPMRNEKGHLVGMVVTFREVAMVKVEPKRVPPMAAPAPAPSPPAPTRPSPAPQSSVPDAAPGAGPAMAPRPPEGPPEPPRARPMQAIAMGDLDFLSGMDHAVRTPLNSIVTAASLLGQARAGEGEHELVEAVGASGERLLRILNDVQEYARLSAGSFEFELAPFETRALLETVLDDVAPLAAERRVELTVEADEHLPWSATGQVECLRRILKEALQAAVGLSAAGDATVSASSLRVSEKRHELRIRIDAPAAKAEDLEKLFRPFSGREAAGGERTGLELAICQRLAEALGGSLWGEPAASGVSIHCTVQVEPAPGEAPRAPTPVVLAGRRLLVASPSAANRRALASEARGWGMAVEETADASEAIEWLRRGETVDAVIVDDQTPQAAELAREAGSTTRGGQTSVVLLAFQTGEEGSSRRAAGFDAVLTKPVNAAAVQACLASVLRPKALVRKARTAFKLDPEMGKRHPLRILLAEDDPINRAVVVQMLSRLGYQADVASNGFGVLQALEQRPYDLVLMDIRMPELDGFETSRRIVEGIPPGERPRMVAITALAKKGDRERCLQAGMDDYLPKPLDAGALLDLLAECAPKAPAAAA